MTYKQLYDVMRAASKHGKLIEGFITFKGESFEREYSQEERTYFFNSNEKAFNDNANGCSIFASCLDGKDIGVRIDQYMRTPNGWKVERCGVVKYQLIVAYERDISVLGIFDTLEMARKAMVSDMAIAMGCCENELQEYENDHECGIETMNAWANEAGSCRGNMDWSIVRLYTGENTVFTM